MAKNTMVIILLQSNLSHQLTSLASLLAAAERAALYMEKRYEVTKVTRLFKTHVARKVVPFAKLPVLATAALAGRVTLCRNAFSWEQLLSNAR